MLEPLLQCFPFLESEGFDRTSPFDPNYNCHAFAMDETKMRWEPGGVWYWPMGVPREYSVEAFINAYGTEGYEVCDDSSLESGFQKIAIYCDKKKDPKHSARQLTDGTWTSKLGGYIDITHKTLKALEGDEYGTATVFLKRKK